MKSTVTYMKRYSHLLALAAAGAVLFGCTNNPVTGRRQLALISEDQAIQAGSTYYVQEMQKYQGSGALNTDKTQIQRLRTIASKIIPQAIAYRSDAADWDWKVNLVKDDKTVNAYCTAGGGIAFYTGLINQLNATDDELAQVMGHEVAHALAKHSQERMSVALAGDTATQILAATATGGKIGAQNISLVNALVWQLPNSRKSESEADRIGIELAAKAGYNPNAAVSLWEKMAKGSGGGFNMLSTHPSSSDRIQALQSLVPQMTKYYETAKRTSPPVYPVSKLD